MKARRSFWSYAKIQHLISAIIRGKTFFIKKNSLKDKVLLNVGCGPHVNSSFVNLDYYWMPHIDVCWDITKNKYPLENESLNGIYTEHCLEHISLDDFIKNVAEFYRMLRPGGSIRIVVPDGELYFTIYNKKLNGEDIKMPFEQDYISPMARINGLFRKYGHKFIFDFETINIVLKQAGFKNIKKEKYNIGRDGNLLIDTDWREIESLYVEATK